MKICLYLPFLAFASLLYTRLVINGSSEFLPIEKQASRSPASKEPCIDTIASFYTTQEISFIEKRIKNAKDFHGFYRSFVPLFYKTVKESKAKNTFAPLKRYVGTIGGDIHVENFGIIADDKGRYIFSLNDVDETTEGEIYQDVLRHYISIDIVSQVSWKEYLKAYLKGIKDEPYPFSYFTIKKLDSAIDDTEKVLAEAIDYNVIKFKSKKKPNREVTNDELLSIKASLGKRFPKLQIYDQYVRVKDDGGSAGMLRFQLLARLSPADKVVWLEVKEQSRSSYDKVFEPTVEHTFDSRLNHLKEDFYEGKLEKGIFSIKLGQSFYMVRPMDRFSLGVDISDLNEADLNDIILDEALALGRMHSQSLKAKSFDVNEYATEWEKIAPSKLEESSDSIRDSLKELYKDSKK